MFKEKGLVYNFILGFITTGVEFLDKKGVRSGCRMMRFSFYFSSKIHDTCLHERFFV